MIAIYSVVFPCRVELRSLSVMLHPESMRQEVRESREHFPPGRSVGQAMIKSRVDYQILAKRTRDRSKIADGVAILEWL